MNIDYSRYDIYEDSNIFDKKINRFLKPHKCAGGYLQVHLSGKRYYLHVIIARKFIPNPLNKKEVNHKDCDKTNNNPSNLEWVTRSENIQHAHLMGRFSRRNASDIRPFADEIRHRYSLGDVSMKYLGESYNVSQAVIFNVIHRQANIYK